MHVKCPRRFRGLETRACVQIALRLPAVRRPDIQSIQLGAVARLAIDIAMTLGATAHAGAMESPVTVIDIALEPDQTMVGHALAANAALLKNFPKGFALDDTHHPQVSIFMGFVPTADLPKVCDAAGKVILWKIDLAISIHGRSMEDG